MCVRVDEVKEDGVREVYCVVCDVDELAGRGQ